MLRKFVSKSQKDWDEYLPYLLFAYREVPQESTGFSPFELFFGRRIRGPLDVLKEAWTGEAGEKTPVVTYVMQMRTHLHDMTEVVRDQAERAQQRQKKAYDHGAKQRKLNVGDEVLVLLPKPQNRLKLEWVGPYKVTREVTPVHFEVETPGCHSERKIYHINLLKKWYASPLDTCEVCLALIAADDTDDREEEEKCLAVKGAEG